MSGEGSSPSGPDPVDRARIERDARRGGGDGRATTIVSVVVVVFLALLLVIAVS